VYGNPCNLEAFQRIADTYGLKIIYDAAHAFGVKVNGESILNYGDLSVLSFHATKVFNTIEGGAIICHDEKTKQRIDYLKNFGFAGETTVIAPGINAKMNELQAAYGLLQLKYVDGHIAKRKAIANMYREQLQNVPGIRCMEDIESVKHAYSYFPVLVETKEYEKARDELYEELKQHNIYGRRYFYPLISQFPSYRGLISARASNLPVAERVAEQVICLPIYPDLELKDVLNICQILIQKK
jgi:dTDP-4-amino-4,6-dideoxygalactose transaminase